MRIHTCGNQVRTCLLIFAGHFLSFGAPAAEVAKPQYTGAGSCSSASCHGALQPRNSTSVLQNEYSTWTLQDKHARGFAVLSNDVSKRIGRILRLQPETSHRCLSCHSLDVPETEKARSFEAADGVSCESCHGASSAWLGPHATRDWNYAKSVALGMVDTRDLVKRNQQCLSCHLGDAEKSVTHELIAAGHPDLYFEISSFSAVEPKHWKEPFPTDPAIEFRGLAVGQAIQMREQMRRIAREASIAWPEYSELDCFSCHHSLTGTKASWRQEAGFPGRKAGTPPWNTSRFTVLRVIANQVDAGARQLEEQAAQVYALISDLRADRREIASAALRTSETADRLANTILQMKLDPVLSLRVMKGICADADRLANAGERSAEQSAMVLNSLYLAYFAKGRKQEGAPLQTAIAGLFQEFESPSAYSPKPFAKRLRDIGSLLAAK